jgi:hypothetical protein
MMTINGGSVVSSTVVRSRNVFKRNSLRFAAALAYRLRIASNIRKWLDTR